MVPGLCDDVAPLTEEEKKLYEKIDFDLDEYCRDVGVGQLLHNTKASRHSKMEMCCITPDYCMVIHPNFSRNVHFFLAGANPNAPLEIPVSLPSWH